MRKEKAVLITDVHYGLPTLVVAQIATEYALALSAAKQLPLLICGDLLDQKSIIRAECANSLINLLKNHSQDIYILVGNHDLLNERSKEHSLNFLRPYATVIDAPTYKKELGLWFIPYNHDATIVKETINTIPAGSTIIMHQGLVNADMGHYIQDKSAITLEDIKNHRVISGHYHRRQDIFSTEKTNGLIGSFSYIGNPFTLTSAEASDPPKGLQILLEDGSLDFVPLNLRKHVKIKIHIDDINFIGDKVGKDDIITITLIGPRNRIALFTKKEIGESILGHNNYKLEIVPDRQLPINSDIVKESKDKAEVLLDKLIDESSESAENKSLLKKEWKELMQ